MLGAALCSFGPPVLAQPPPSPAASHELRAGARLTFVSDDTVNPKTVRPGSRFRLHLAAPLLLGSTILASAGTPARLVVLETQHAADDSVVLRIGIAEFRLTAGLLPVEPVDDRVGALISGSEIAARTQGRVEEREDRIVIRVPPPFSLKNDEPVPAFTPIPIRTPQPRPARPPRSGARPSPSPEPSVSPSPSAAP